MNLVTINQNNNNIKTMTSLEIAELTNKTHSHVLRDIRRMIEELNDPYMDSEQYQVVMNDKGQTSEILLDRELTETLITGYSVVIRRAVIKRWKELEEQVAAPVLPNFNNPVEAARAWANEVEQKQLVIEQVVVLEEQNAVLTPKGQFFDTVAKSNALQSVSEVAKKQGISAQALNKVLRSINIYDNRYPRKNIFKDKVIQQADGKVVLDKSGRSVSMFTNKGEINIVNNFLYTPTAIKIVEDHYHNDDKKLKDFRANIEARSRPAEVNLARLEHTQATINTINNLLH